MWEALTDIPLELPENAEEYLAESITCLLYTSQFCRRKSLVFPDFKKSDIRIQKYDCGSHYYAFVGDMQVRDGDRLKWNTYEEAYRLSLIHI